MIRVGIVLTLCAICAKAASVPAGTTAALTLAALAGFAAVRLHATAEELLVRGNDTAPTIMRLSRVLHDLGLALSVLGLLDAVKPI